MKVDKISKQLCWFMGFGRVIPRLTNVVTIFLCSSFVANASPGVSSMKGLGVLMFIAAGGGILILLMLNNVLYKKSKRKLVWLLTPVIILTFYLFLILPTMQWSSLFGH
jgi:hypothetical protein